MADLTSVAGAAITNVPMAAQIASTVPTTSDIQGTITVIASIVAGVIAMAWPIMRLVRMWNVDKTNNSKDSAESFLYKHLKDQIEEAKKDNALAKEENLRLWKIIREMETRLKKVEDYEASNEKLKHKLDDKDCKLRQKDDMIESLRAELEVSSRMIAQLYRELRERDAEIKLLQEDVKQLKARLNTDEKAILNLQHDPAKNG